MGCEVYRVRPRNHRPPHRQLSSSDAALRIICDAARLLLFALVAQAQTLWRASDTRLRSALLHHSLCYRIRARRPARGYFRVDEPNRSLDFATNQHRRWNLCAHHPDRAATPASCESCKSCHPVQNIRMNSLTLLLLTLPLLFQLPAEKHLRNLKQLTFGGENAEAYFSADGKQLIFQSTRDGHGCDQIYTMNIDGSNVKMISNGDGRTTCSYFF